MERRYLALRIVAVVYKVLSILILVGAVVSSVLSLMLGATILANSDLGSSVPVGGIVLQIVGAVITLVIGVLLALPFAAFGQMIDLFIAMEQNTRATVQVMQQQTGILSAMANEIRSTSPFAPPMSPERPMIPPSPREQIGAAPH